MLTARRVYSAVAGQLAPPSIIIPALACVLNNQARNLLTSFIIFMDVVSR